jgi:hypothetical protein
MKEDELKYDEPPVLIGTGSFGQVKIDIFFRVLVSSLRASFKILLIRTAETCILIRTAETCITFDDNLSLLLLLLLMMMMM